jgi:single-strand DNA-binding protein
MKDVTITVVGNVVNDVTLSRTGSGVARTTFRIAHNTRRYDKVSDGYVDAETLYLSVVCWRALAENVATSISKSMPVVVTGRLRIVESDRECPQCRDHTHRTRYVEIDASSVGPDLTRGRAKYERTKSAAVIRAEDRALEEARALTA